LSNDVNLNNFCAKIIKSYFGDFGDFLHGYNNDENFSEKDLEKDCVVRTF